MQRFHRGGGFIHESKRPLGATLAEAMAEAGVQHLRVGETVTPLTLKVGSAARYWAREQQRVHGGGAERNGFRVLRVEADKGR